MKKEGNRAIYLLPPKIFRNTLVPKFVLISSSYSDTLSAMTYQSCFSIASKGIGKPGYFSCSFFQFSRIPYVKSVEPLRHYNPFLHKAYDAQLFLFPYQETWRPHVPHLILESTVASHAHPWYHFLLASYHQALWFFDMYWIDKNKLIAPCNQEIGQTSPKTTCRFNAKYDAGFILIFLNAGNPLQ